MWLAPLVSVASLALAVATAAPQGSADLSAARTLLEQAKAARQTSDYATARAKAAEATAALLARSAAERDSAWVSLLESAARAADAAHDPRTDADAWKGVFEYQSATLPDDHPDLLRAR